MPTMTNDEIIASTSIFDAETAEDQAAALIKAGGLVKWVGVFIERPADLLPGTEAIVARRARLYRTFAEGGGSYAWYDDANTRRWRVQIGYVT